MIAWMRSKSMGWHRDDWSSIDEIELDENDLPVIKPVDIEEIIIWIHTRSIDTNLYNFKRFIFLLYGFPGTINA